MRLITKFNEHQAELTRAIKNSESIFMAVAFVKQSGVNLIYDTLKSAASKDCKIVIICGLDFSLTEPAALKALRKLSLQYPSLELYMASPVSKRQIFHPKVYLFTKNDHAVIITGSANLTSGGCIDPLILGQNRFRI